MTFEGEHRAIPLRGIERATADGVAADGGMNEVIGVIPRNGSYVPYSPTEAENPFTDYTTADVKITRVHHTSTGDNAIFVYPSRYKIVTLVDSQVVELVDREKVIDEIVFIGNRMDLSTPDGIEHWLWKNGEYVNVDDLGIHENNTSALPSVSFKVSRGIYDGSKVYKSARYVRLHKNYTGADTGSPNYGEAEKYVRNAGSMGSDAVALLDSIRHAGGITGYVLVAAAWRVKGSDASHPKYIMASPVMLMGAPEIYMKDGNFEKQDNIYLEKPDYDSLLDMFNYQEILERMQQTSPSSYWSSTFQDAVAEKLWDMPESDDRDMEDIEENEHVNIEMEEDGTPCVLRKENASHEKYVLNSPALWSSKFALWRGGSDAEHRGIRIAHGTANVLYYKLNSVVEDRYKDEVDRLCIFISPVISPYKRIDTTGVKMDLFTKFYASTSGLQQYYYYNFVDESINMNRTSNSHVVCSSFTPIMKSEQEIRDEIKNVAGLYKVAEVQLNEMGDTTDEWIKINLSEGRLSTDRMVQQSDTMLKISDFQPVGFIQGHIFGYNERLHVFNFQKNDVYRLPYEASAYHGGDGQYKNQTANSPIFEYYVKVVDSNDSTIVSHFTSDSAELNPLLSCADIDAKSITVLVKYELEGVYYAKMKEYHPIGIGGVVGGHCEEDLKPWNAMDDFHEITDEEYDALYFEDDIKPDSYSWGKNEIRVSNTATTIFEVDKSYKVGHGEIIALARLSMGLSQDNYSKFPLIVFCTDGIYTLGVDATGKYAYSSQDPLSRVVCTNPNGICEIDGAVLFPSEYGLQIVTENGVKPVAVQAIGAPKNLPEAEYGLGLYNSAVSQEGNGGRVVNLIGGVSNKDFLEDIQDVNTYIKYLHALNMVIVYNKGRKYSYMIDLQSWMVTKLYYRIYVDDNDYPKQKFYHMKGVRLTTTPVVFDYYSGENNTQVLLATRPMPLQTTHLKTAYRVVLRGEFNCTDNDKFAIMLVYGSLDGINWDYLNGIQKELTNNRFHDIGVETHHVSYKYMMVVLAGNLSKDSHIETLEITSNERYNNKLK